MIQKGLLSAAAPLADQLLGSLIFWGPGLGVGVEATLIARETDTPDYGPAKPLKLAIENDHRHSHSHAYHLTAARAVAHP